MLLSKWIKAPDASKIDYAKIVSEITGVPRTTIIRAKKIHGLASAKLKEEIRAGDISISKAYDKIVEAEKQKKKTEKIDKRKRDFEKNNFALNEIETLLSKELLGSTIGFKGKEIKASVVQKKNRSMLYAVSYHHEIFYLRVYYQTFEAEEGPEHFTVFLMHEGMDFKVPKGAGVLTVNPLGNIKLVKKCQAAKVVSEQQELKLLRSMIMENLAG